MDSPPPPAFSLVIPCYNESEVLAALEVRLLSAMGRLAVDWEVLFVNDGSRDNTLERLCAMHAREPRFKVISLSRNFGHQAAISAGLAHATLSQMETGKRKGTVAAYKAIAKALGFGEEKASQKSEQLCSEVSRMLIAMMRKLKA